MSQPFCCKSFGALRLFLALLVATLLAACKVGPDYRRPAVEMPASYKEASHDWQQAAPRDGIDRGAWWSLYKDPVLDKLEAQVYISNQNLKAAEAAYREAGIAVKETRATLFPSLTLNSSVGNMQGVPPISMLPNSLYGAAAWAPDVWGRIRRGIDSDKANAEASAADLAAARLSMQATLATDYFELRAQDESKRLLDMTVEADTRAMQIARRQYDTGTGDVADVLTAQTELENIQSDAVNTSIRRAQLEHAIAVLVGKPPSDVSVAPRDFVDATPEIPAGVPSTLLERRPDIAAAERRMAAANAQIGVATAAWYPDLTLSGSSGFASLTLSKLFQASNSFWTIGPALGETIFDAGARKDRIEQARAAYDRNAALYRQTVLTAFQQVEDNLAALRILAEQRTVQEISVSHARATEQLMRQRYMNGAVPYSSVLTAQTARLNDEQSLLKLRQNRLDASVALIQALGGGWDVSQLPAFVSGHLVQRQTKASLR